MSDGADDASNLKDATDSLFICVLNDLRILLHDYLRYRSEPVPTLAVVNECNKDAMEEGIGLLFRVATKVVLHEGSDET